MKIAPLLLVLSAACGSSPGTIQSDATSALNAAATASIDLSTPARALQSIEDAYRARDIEATVACKDFLSEARFMLQQGNLSRFGDDEQLIAQTAEVLELAYRRELTQAGFPDMTHIATKVVGTREIRPDLVRLTEETTLTDDVYFVRRDDKWRMVIVPAEPR